MSLDLEFESQNGPTYQILKGYGTPYHGYLFRMEYDNTPWPEYSDRQLAFYRDNPHDPRKRGVVAIKCSGEELFFTNRDKASEYFQQILKSGNDVSKAINRKRIVNGYSLYYYYPSTDTVDVPTKDLVT